MLLRSLNYLKNINEENIYKNNTLYNIISRKFIKNKIQNLEDLFDRKNLLKKVKIDKSYPKYILNNKKKILKKQM
mgnify:CR=1 FL=1